MPPRWALNSCPSFYLWIKFRETSPIIPQTPKTSTRLSSSAEKGSADIKCDRKVSFSLCECVRARPVIVT